MEIDNAKTFAELFYEVVHAATGVINESPELTPAKEKLATALINLESDMLQDRFKKVCANN